MWRICVRQMSGTAKSIRTPIPVFGVEGRYVAALYSAAHQMQQLEKAEESLVQLQKELTKPKVIDFIETSMISSAAKAALLKDVGGKVGMPSAVINFLEVVAENGRLQKLRRMINMFRAVMVAHRKQTLCEVITAKPLDSSTRSALMDALKKLVKDDRAIQLTEKVDPTVIGGMVVGIEDKHIDLSIAKKIVMYTELIKKSV